MPNNSALLNSEGGYHLIDLDHVDKACLTALLDRAEQLDESAGPNPSNQPAALLPKCNIVNLFFEVSTRTRTSFEIASRSLGANVINFDVRLSSTAKGETLKDTLFTLSQMDPDIFVLRHGSSGTAQFVSQLVEREYPIGLINAGDGRHAHPTQALADLLTMRQSMRENDFPIKNFSDLSVLIVGDLYHSRVGRSLIQGLQKFNTRDIRSVAPPTLNSPLLPVENYVDLRQAVQGVDFIIALRLQAERMQTNRVPTAREYFRFWGITEEILDLASKHVRLMHPGPIMRGGDLSSAVADGPNARILNQVRNGVTVRKAVVEKVYSELSAVRQSHG